MTTATLIYLFRLRGVQGAATHWSRTPGPRKYVPFFEYLGTARLIEDPTSATRLIGNVKLPIADDLIANELR